MFLESTSVNIYRIFLSKFADETAIQGFINVTLFCKLLQFLVLNPSKNQGKSIDYHLNMNSTPRFLIKGAVVEHVHSGNYLGVVLSNNFK